MYHDSNYGQKPFSFAMAEKIDNAIAATTVVIDNLLVRIH